MPRKQDGCAFGRESRIMIENTQGDISEIKKTLVGIDGNGGMAARIEELFNHQSSRLPPWVTALGCVASGVIVGLVVYVLTHVH